MVSLNTTVCIKKKPAGAWHICPNTHNGVERQLLRPTLGDKASDTHYLLTDMPTLSPQTFD